MENEQRKEEAETNCSMTMGEKYIIYQNMTGSIIDAEKKHGSKWVTVDGLDCNPHKNGNPCGICRISQ